MNYLLRGVEERLVLTEQAVNRKEIHGLSSVTVSGQASSPELYLALRVGYGPIHQLKIWVKRKITFYYVSYKSFPSPKTVPAIRLASQILSNKSGCVCEKSKLSTARAPGRPVFQRASTPVYSAINFRNYFQTLFLSFFFYFLKNKRGSCYHILYAIFMTTLSKYEFKCMMVEKEGI